jgi:hypothetical protein
MARRMVVGRPGREMPVLVEVVAHLEAELHDLMMSHPELLPVDELDLEGPLLVVGKETVLASGAIDLVGLTPYGDVVIIEFKTGPQNPDFRSALSQLLDYGSDLFGMDVKVFEETVAVRYFQSQHCTTEYKGTNSLADAFQKTWPAETVDEFSAFTERLGNVLSSGAFHFVVVAQRFTPAMENTAIYLNTLNPSVKFHLIEMVHFTGHDLDAYEARVVLKPIQSSGKASAQQSVSEASFLAQLAEETLKEHYSNLFAVAHGLGLRFEWGSVGTSIRLATSDKPEPVSVAWIFPPGVTGWMGLHDLTFGYDPSQADGAPSALVALDTYVDAISHLPAAEKVTKAGLKGYSFKPHAFTAVATIVGELLAKLVSEAAATDSRSG